MSSASVWRWLIPKLTGLQFRINEMYFNNFNRAVSITINLLHFWLDKNKLEREFNILKVILIYIWLFIFIIHIPVMNINYLCQQIIWVWLGLVLITSPHSAVALINLTFIKCVMSIAVYVMLLLWRSS